MEASTSSASVIGSTVAQQPVSLQRQVFISHTGADEGGRIFAASILKPALERAGLKVFVDFEHLKPGCFWSAELVKAAATSAVFVAVLTEAYPERYWCLRELDLAMHGHPDYPCQGKPHIIPVFYDPSSRVCYDSGGRKRPSADNVQQLVQQQLDRLAAVQEMTAEQQQLQKELREHADAQRWANNLDVTKLKQAVLRRHDTAPKAVGPVGADREQQQQQQQLPQQQQQQQQRKRDAGVPPPKDEEWQMARQVVAEAVLHIPLRLSSTSKLVGFEQQQADLLSLLAVQENDVIGLWLHGAGGSGKSTMANLLYDSLRTAYEHAAAVTLDLCASDSNVPQQKQYLEQQLLQQLAPDYNRNTPSLSVPQQLGIVLTDMRVLLLVDNISAAQQLTDLLPVVTGKGSCVIITSRQASIPLGADNCVNMVHRQMGLLDAGCKPRTYSRQLFRQWSCVQDPTEDILQIEDELLQACGGLPLALMIIGGQVREKQDVADWQAVRSTFLGGHWSSNDPTEAKLQDIVCRSFSSLTEAARNIFLDCVSIVRRGECFTTGFLKMPLWDAKKVWDAWWGPGATKLALNKLQDLAFISFTEDDQSHLSPTDLVVLDVLRLLGQSILHGTLQPAGLAAGNRYTGSRIWTEGDSTGPLLGVTEAMDLSSLRPTVISGCVPLTQFNLSCLRVLRCSILKTTSRGAMGWGRLLTNSRQLLMLEELPSVSPSPVKRSDSSLIKKLMSFLMSHSILYLDSLFDAYVVHCGTDCCYLPEALPYFNPVIVRLQGDTALPTDILGSLAAAPQPRLIDLDIPLGSRHLGYVAQHAGDSEADGLGQEALELLRSLSRFTALQQLRLKCGAKLRMLPEPFSLPALRVLELLIFDDLRQLPNSLQGSTDLESLRLYGCASLTSLPDWVGHFPRLQELDVSRCGQLANLPGSLTQLKALKMLKWYRCGSLERSEETSCLLRTLSAAPMNVDVWPTRPL